MADGNPAKPRMSLYANLLNAKSNTKDGNAADTISGAPVLYEQATGASEKPEDIIAAAKSKLSAAALRFQPTKRPTAASQKPKPSGPPKNAASAPHGSVAAAAVAAAASAGQTITTKGSTEQKQEIGRQLPKTTIEDWAGDEEEDAYYLDQKRQQQQRGGRKRRKKNKDQAPQPVNWDDIYDPSRPNNYEEYKNSEESIREARDWKDRLYAHRIARRRSSSGGSFSDSDDGRSRPQLKNQFAPPGMSFAPPRDLNDDSAPTPPPPPPPPPPIDASDDTTGDDAYARRMRMSQANQTQFAPPPPPPPPPPLPESAPEPPSRPNMPQPDISRAPVRYSLPAPPAEIPASEAELEDALQHEETMYIDDSEATASTGEEPKSLRPGQKGFAERLMNKYGWTKGSGLGVQGTGITTALRVQVEKAKRKPDSEGGGFVGGTQGRGKIIGGKKKENGDGEGKFGAMSEVIVLLGMVDGMDLQAELGDGNLMQEIGEECGDKYGRVERVFIDQSATGSVPVFVKFTSQLSGLRAVNALEGRVFNGNTITARFFDKDKFDGGDYSLV